MSYFLFTLPFSCKFVGSANNTLVFLAQRRTQNLSFVLVSTLVRIFRTFPPLYFGSEIGRKDITEF